MNSRHKQLDAAAFERSLAMRSKAHSLIPGGAHTYAKGDDQYPVLAPSFLTRGEGCHVWDIDGNEFIEYGMGLRAVTLGHAYKPVVEAAHRQMLLGENYTRPATIELTCAEEFLGLIEGADMVKFAKNGSDATTAAVRLARAYTGRDLIARCGDQPFFSTDDWFIGNTPMSAGIPKVVQDLTLQFRYNDIESLRSLFAQHPGEIACVIMEAATAVEPQPGFLHAVQALCRKEGAVFILDEMITGFRWNVGGAQREYGITPDLSTFGKGIGNGFSVSALAGKRELMELGGLRDDRERVFLLSTTHGAENHALAAAIATMQVYRNDHVIEHLHRQGERLRAGVNPVIKELGIGDHFELLGRASNMVFATRDTAKQPSQPFRTLFLQEMIKRGIITPSLVVSFSHTDADIDRTIEAIAESLKVYRSALEDGVDHYLVGRPVKPVFRKFS
ncbi:MULTISPECIES: glutamate-1-semialdehyde 2,1-aminomutase [Bradyrhizobium]|nr:MULTISPECIES: glutamate-1-semialdehyde 2,1-aminomutase [Bradyrhizobium]MDU0956260.1 glutamate-1-semialdehyde 2,1-aminomutase [Bradyrhizobium sp.]MDU1491036.1 glutamate-1-semialdehyde 2,1-aminomutase [Bradyrhizobium sp.]MDU1541214.1 glutamate-1-semialdehyde 2,1-aminomutase [Bradyrhizobium sp.]MDU1803831.1 glutamate-1-semialdehyde 2,1-aminomutase [Bradyrhizobium sp.]MDU2922518.1 glutamate-1-semialdehyde 2,1-aminomutase [Bradyrhizobium sp.]